VSDNKPVYFYILKKLFFLKFFLEISFYTFKYINIKNNFLKCNFHSQPNIQITLEKVRKTMALIRYPLGKERSQHDNKKNRHQKTVASKYLNVRMCMWESGRPISQSRDSISRIN
jgi:hypothetical protein